MNNLNIFLDLIGWSEGTTTVGYSDNGYNVIIGGTLFYNNYVDHPRPRVWVERIGQFSSASGKYQIISKYFDDYKESLNLPDFSPKSQDAIATQMIKECQALDDINNGKISLAIVKCASRWASFPSNNYQQSLHTVQELQDMFVQLGGLIEGNNDVASA